MRLGFAVKVLGAGGLPSHDTRRWQSGPHLSVSLDRLEAVLGYLEDNAIGFYRIATPLAPHAPPPAPPPRLAPRPAPVPRPAARVRRAPRARGRAGARERDPPLHPPRPVHRPQLRGRGGGPP